uniref:Uncharacterized protein n=1 Tax=Eutreptiella gymnastica TaxID=73025 RepID=A0A6U8P036_9EUGL
MSLHLALLQSVLLPLGMRFGADSHPIIDAVLWCLVQAEPFAFYRNQEKVATALPEGCPRLTPQELQSRVQSADYTQTLATMRSQCLRFCASASDALARELLNSAALMVPDTLLCVDALERALEAFVRGAPTGERASPIAAATLSLPPDCDALEFRTLCRSKGCNLLFLIALRQLLPHTHDMPTPTPSYAVTEPDAPLLQLAQEPRPAEIPMELHLLLSLMAEGFQAKINPEREWDILAIYALLVEVLQHPAWDVRFDEVIILTKTVLDILSAMGTPSSRLLRLPFAFPGATRPHVSAQRCSPELGFAFACLEIYALQSIKKQLLSLPKSLAERVSDNHMARKIQDLELRAMALGTVQIAVVTDLRNHSQLEDPQELSVFMGRLQKLLAPGCLLHKL